MKQMSHSGQNKQNGGQSQAQASEILLARSSIHLHNSIRKHLLCGVSVCNNSISLCIPSKQCHFFTTLAKVKIYITDFSFGDRKLYWGHMFPRWENVQNVGQNPSPYILSHCQPLGFLSLPYLVVSGNGNRMLHIYTSGEISVSLVYLWYNYVRFITGRLQFSQEGCVERVECFRTILNPSDNDVL